MKNLDAAFGGSNISCEALSSEESAFFTGWCLGPGLLRQRGALTDSILGCAVGGGKIVRI